jgi:hypothetical protein
VLTSLPARIAAKITPSADSDCWAWTGAVNNHGYGQMWWGGRLVQAHRLVYHLLVDPTLSLWPGKSHAGFDLDHSCRVKWCVNPAHLEIVTHRENGIRGMRGALGDHTSKFVGVSWHAERHRWQVQIQVDGQARFLGHFRDEVAAAITYDNAAERQYADRPNERLFGAEVPDLLSADFI